MVRRLYSNIVSRKRNHSSTEDEWSTLRDDMKRSVTWNRTPSSGSTSLLSSSSNDSNNTISKDFMFLHEDCMTSPDQAGYCFVTDFNKASKEQIENEITNFLDSLTLEPYLQETNEKNSKNLNQSLAHGQKNEECKDSLFLVDTNIMNQEGGLFFLAPDSVMHEKTRLSELYYQKSENISTSSVCLPLKSPIKPYFSFSLPISPEPHYHQNTKFRDTHLPVHCNLTLKSASRSSTFPARPKSFNQNKTHFSQSSFDNKDTLRQSLSFNKRVNPLKNSIKFDKVTSLSVSNTALRYNDLRLGFGREYTASNLDELLLQRKYKKSNSGTDSSNYQQHIYNHAGNFTNNQERDNSKSRISPSEKLASATTAKMMLDPPAKLQSVSRHRLSLGGTNSPVIHHQELAAPDLSYKKTNGIAAVSRSSSNRPATMIPSIQRRSTANLRGLAASDPTRRRSWNFTSSSSQYGHSSRQPIQGISIESGMPHYQNPTVVSQLRDIRNHVLLESPTSNANGRTSPGTMFRRRDSSGSLMLHNKNILLEPEEAPISESTEIISQYSHSRPQSSLSNRDKVDAFLKEQQLAEYEDAENNFFSVDTSKYVRRIHSMDDDLYMATHVKTLFFELEGIKKMVTELQERVAHQEMEAKMRPIRPIPMVVKKTAEESILENKTDTKEPTKSAETTKELTNQEIQDYIAKLSEKLERMFEEKQQEKNTEQEVATQKEDFSDVIEEPSILSEGLRKRDNEDKTVSSNDSDKVSVVDMSIVEAKLVEEVSEISPVTTSLAPVTTSSPALLSSSPITGPKHQSLFEKASLHIFMLVISFFVVILTIYLLVTLYLFMVEYTERTNSFF